MNSSELLQLRTQCFLCPGGSGGPGQQGPPGPPGPPGEPYPTGNLLRVDQIYGNDSVALQAPYTIPFKTIVAALGMASSGQTVWIYPGVYNENITIPEGVSVRGTSVQTTIIQRLNVPSSTTLVVMNQNTRLEDVTLNLSSATNGITLIGVNFLSGASVNAKLRTAVVNVTFTGAGGTQVYGIQSAGTSSLVSTSSNAIRACTIKVISSSTVDTRGIIISNANRFVIRDTNVYVDGSGSDLIGCETTQASSFLELKTSSINGTKYDINRLNGTILLSFTDLVNNNANNNSFTVTAETNTYFFGILGDLGNNTTYHLVPSIVPIANISTTTPFPINFNQTVIVYSIYVKFTGTLTGTDTITFTIYKDNIATDLTLTLTSSDPIPISKKLITKSVTFLSTNTLDARVTTVGNPGTGTFYASMDVY
jgi:hypothetical protein